MKNEIIGSQKSIEEIVAERFDNGSIILKSFSKNRKILPYNYACIITFSSGLLSAFLLAFGMSRLASAALIIYFIVLIFSRERGSEFNTKLNSLAARRFYLLRIFFDALILLSAGFGIKHPIFGLTAAIFANIFSYSAISLVVEIPAICRINSPESVIKLNSAFFSTSHYWAMGRELCDIVFIISCLVGKIEFGLWIIIFLPAILLPQWISLWEKIIATEKTAQ
ncbi:TPA: hypothetical protein DEF17_09595 [bacterium]|nr:hypothetical protein [bacterium]